MGGSKTPLAQSQHRHRAFTTLSLGGEVIRRSSYAASGGGFLHEGDNDDDDGIGIGTKEDDESPHFCCVVCHPDRCANRVNRYSTVKFFLTMVMMFGLCTALAVQIDDLIQGLSDTAWKETIANDPTVTFPAVEVCQPSPMVAVPRCRFVVSQDDTSDHGDHAPGHGTFTGEHTSVSSRGGRPTPSRYTAGGGGLSNDPVPFIPATLSLWQNCSARTYRVTVANTSSMCYTLNDNWEADGNAAHPATFRASGSPTGMMQVSFEWINATGKSAHTLVKLFDPDDKTGIRKPAFYMKFGALYYVLLSKAVDINIIGKRETRYTAVPSDVTLKEHNESVAEINFSFQSEYVLERTEHHSYDWGMLVATMGGFISAFNYTRMTLLFCYKVCTFDISSCRGIRRKRRLSSATGCTRPREQRSGGKYGRPLVNVLDSPDSSDSDDDALLSPETDDSSSNGRGGGRDDAGQSGPAATTHVAGRATDGAQDACTTTQPGQRMVPGAVASR